ncbi:3'-5' exonuclease [Pedobacter glucosidilyticus]|uniref:3'-5' exonuclease n=1 Tax=Pedobacter glucosidilyticus TaxID=1122941 RepID=UPI0004052EE1|nr:3'-5' exonuclease [Pedobacter glucosidilyticus]
MAIQADKILVIDLEATCWGEDGSYQQQNSEIIEIGLCILNVDSGEIEANEGILVKPVHSDISDFCTQLTSITPEMIEQEGRSLEEAIVLLREKYHSLNYSWASYGAYDKNMLLEQCKRFNVEYPMSSSHINVKTLLSRKLNLEKGLGMQKALKRLNIPLEGTHHRGVDDAKNIAKILKLILKK